MKNKLKYISLAVLAIFLFTAQIPEEEPLVLKKEYIPYKEMVDFLPVMPGKFIPYLDTVYVLGDRFIEVSLKDQMATLYIKGEKPQHFPISSGNSRLRGGVATPTGIYTIQTKSKAEISEEFDNTVMYNWLGFNFDIGFHSLKSTNYYRHLGKNPSSHGCLRTSNEDAAALFDQVGLGTPVLVYDEPPARVLAFGDFLGFDYDKDLVIQNRNMDHKKLTDARLEMLKSRKDLHEVKRNFFLDSRTIIYRNLDICSIYDIKEPEPKIAKAEEQSSGEEGSGEEIVKKVSNK